MNLVKNIGGSGILSLSAGIAAFSARRAAVGPAVAILAATGALSAYAMGAQRQLAAELSLPFFSSPFCLFFLFAKKTW